MQSQKVAIALLRMEELEVVEEHKTPAAIRGGDISKEVEAPPHIPMEARALIVVVEVLVVEAMATMVVVKASADMQLEEADLL